MKYFVDENGKKYTEAYIDGYSIAERLLEGVTFKIYIENNEVKVEVIKEDEEYFEQFNKKYYYDMIIYMVINEDEVFNETPDGGEELIYEES